MHVISSRGRLAVAVAGLFLAGVFAWLAPGSARAGEEPTACESVSVAQVQKTLGLDHSTVLRDTSNMEGTNGTVRQDVHTECDLGLWSGKQPGSRAALVKMARAGQAAQFGVATWAPNEDSPEVSEWEQRGFPKLTGEFLKSRFAFLQIPGRAKPLNPEGDGYIGAGVLIKATGIATGLDAAVGCWWDHHTYRAICLFDEEARSRPVVDHLNKLGKKIVPKFLGSP